MYHQPAVTRWAVKAGSDPVKFFASKKDAERYAKRCGKPKVLEIPVTR